MSNIWFTSDTHYNHANIASKNSSKWKEGYRHYSSLQEMNQDIVKQFNKNVKQDDVVYHLGDWSFGGIESIWKFRRQLLCDQIHLILGNHDQHIEDKKVISIPEDQRDEIFHKYGGYAEVACRDLFESVNYYKELKINQNQFVLSHYAHRIWHGSHKGWIHLYGHSHDSLDESGQFWGKSMDVGIDSAIRILGAARPFHINEIYEIMDKREVKLVDHHNSKTNI